MVQSKVLIEGWPALMSSEMAALYLSLDKAAFATTVRRFKIHPVNLDQDLVRWRKADLDRLIKSLEVAPLIETNSGTPLRARINETEIERIADAVAKRLNGGPPTGQRALISIKEASEILGVGRSTIYRMIGDDSLSTRQIGRRTLIPTDQIQSILDGDTEPA